MNLRLSSMILALAITGCSEALDEGGNSRPLTAADPAKPRVEQALTGSIANTEFAALVQTSVAQSPNLAAGIASIQASKTRIESERGYMRPQLNAETSLTSGGDAVPIMRLSQIIYDGGKVSGRVDLRRIEARQVWLTELSEISARSFAAVEAIINLSRSRRLETQAMRNLQKTQDLVDDLLTRFDAGAGSVADLLSGQGRQSNAETELAQAHSDVAYAIASWVEIFGSRPGAIPAIPAAPRLTGATAQDMVARSPRLRSQIEQSEVRQQEVVVTERSILPTLSAILETDFDQGTIDNGAQARLGVNIPIYKGGVIRSNVETARAALDQSRADEEVLRRELLRNLEQALEETRSIQVRLASARHAAGINNEALDAARGQFEVSRGTFLQILDALRELNTAEVRVIRLEAQERRAQYAILAVTGDILNALGIVQPVDPTL